MARELTMGNDWSIRLARLFSASRGGSSDSSHCRNHPCPVGRYGSTEPGSKLASRNSKRSLNRLPGANSSPISKTEPTAAPSSLAAILLRRRSQSHSDLSKPVPQCGLLPSSCLVTNDRLAVIDEPDMIRETPQASGSPATRRSAAPARRQNPGSLLAPTARSVSSQAAHGRESAR